MVLDHARSDGALTVSITNIKGIVDKSAEYNLNNQIGAEIAMPATKSYMSQALLLAEIMAGISQNPELIRCIDAIPSAITEALNAEKLICDNAKFFRYADSVEIISRGITHAAMKEAELKMQETASINARAYSASDYTHGPFAMTNNTRPYIFVLVDRKTDSFTMELYQRMLEKRIFAMAITNKPELAKEFPIAIVLPENCEGVCDAFSAVTVMQLFANWLAVYRGINPDKPEGVSKTVVTV